MRFLLSLLLTLFTLVGCGSHEADTASDSAQLVAPDPALAGSIVLQLGVDVNAPDPIAIATGGPRVTLFGDGTVEFFNRNDESTSTGTLPFSRLSLDDDAMAALIDAATAVLRHPIEDEQDLGDADTAWIILDGERHRVDWRSSRTLLDVESIVGVQTAPKQPVEFEQVLVFGLERSGMGPSGLEQLPIEVDASTEHLTRVLPVWCTEVSGAELAEISSELPSGAFSTANWLVEGRAHIIGTRPVFAGEPGCEVLGSL